MAYKIVGLELDIPYSLVDKRTGVQKEGTTNRFFLVDVEEKVFSRDNGSSFLGRECVVLNVPNRFNPKDFEIGDVITFYYNRWRKLDVIMKVNK